MTNERRIANAILIGAGLTLLTAAATFVAVLLHGIWTDWHYPVTARILWTCVVVFVAAFIVAWIADDNT